MYCSHNETRVTSGFNFNCKLRRNICMYCSHNETRVTSGFNFNCKLRRKILAGNYCMWNEM